MQPRVCQVISLYTGITLSVTKVTSCPASYFVPPQKNGWLESEVRSDKWNTQRNFLLFIHLRNYIMKIYRCSRSYSIYKNIYMCQYFDLIITFWSDLGCWKCTLNLANIWQVDSKYNKFGLLWPMHNKLSWIAVSTTAQLRGFQRFRTVLYTLGEQVSAYGMR